MDTLNMYRYEYFPRYRIDIFHTLVWKNTTSRPAARPPRSGAVSSEIKQPARETESPTQ